MQTVADMRGVGVKNREKIADVLYGRPPMLKTMNGDPLEPFEKLDR